MSKERITLVAFVHPVDFLGMSAVESWRSDRHGPDMTNERFAASEVSISQGIVTIRPIGDRPPGKEGESARWRTVRVPLTNVRHWQTEPAAE